MTARWPLRFRAELSFPVGQKARWVGARVIAQLSPSPAASPAPGVPTKLCGTDLSVSGLLGVLVLDVRTLKRSVNHTQRRCPYSPIPCVPLRPAPRLAMTSLQKPGYPRPSEHPARSLGWAAGTVPPAPWTLHEPLLWTRLALPAPPGAWVLSPISPGLRSRSSHSVTLGFTRPRSLRAQAAHQRKIQPGRETAPIPAESTRHPSSYFFRSSTLLLQRCDAPLRLRRFKV